MEALRRLTGTAVADERPLAGRIVGWMFVVGAVLTTILPLLPGAEGKVLTPTLPIGVLAFFWGLHAALRTDWTASRRVGHARRRVRGLACIAIAIADTGGVNSPARFLLLLTLVFAAYFFPAREAWPYLGFGAHRPRARRSSTTRTRSARRCSASC